MDFLAVVGGGAVVGSAALGRAVGAADDGPTAVAVGRAEGLVGGLVVAAALADDVAVADPTGVAVGLEDAFD